MAHKLPDLPFAPDALAPHLSAETLSFHHGKHHAAYVTKLNAALDGTGLENVPLEELVATLDRVPAAKRTAVFNNGAQHFNHSFYWSCLSPKGGGEPTGPLKAAIDAAFGSYADFRKRFKDESVGHFASGWGWLVRDGSGALQVVSTHDADTPLAHGLKPLLTCDVWEHAYYIDYRNDRGTYLDNFFDLVDWDFVSANFEG